MYSAGRIPYLLHKRQRYQNNNNKQIKKIFLEFYKIGGGKWIWLEFYLGVNVYLVGIALTHAKQLSSYEVKKPGEIIVIFRVSIILAARHTQRS